ncbi:hypothetical protein M501DRAFT_1061964 [Patellaria atrata CBS 101060]|uniref:Uncharacterized protein n=1 Tax=Patellaria atrata CBS 101060 TaxID=1346257 RepID=A0A9P4VLF8_9PEZI|nr:hypothetical protein M501DRAFT_1061964 [Patellaria atrata CBS 101060]
MLTKRQDVLYGNSVTSEVKFKTVTSKSMGKIDGKNNYEESKYMRERPSLNIPILHSQFGVLTPFWTWWPFWTWISFYVLYVHYVHNLGVLDVVDVDPPLRPLRPLRP